MGGDGTLKLDLSDMNGDVVASVAPDATSVTGYSESTEYGAPRNPATAADDYGWKSGKKRPVDDLGGLTLMGARLSNPTTGRFLTTDPVPGGNPNSNPYTYPLNPNDDSDLTGQCLICEVLHQVVHFGVDHAASTVNAYVNETKGVGDKIRNGAIKLHAAQTFENFVIQIKKGPRYNPEDPFEDFSLERVSAKKVKSGKGNPGKKRR